VKIFSWVRSNRLKLFSTGKLLLCLGTFVGAQNVPVEKRTADPDARFKIAGTIVNALTRAPLGKARVSLVDTADGTEIQSMITSGDGHFAFAPLHRGKFALQGDKRGFIPSAYEQHEQFSTAIVTGPSFHTDSVVLRLTPLAALCGKVIDEAGEGVRKANVMLYVENHQGGMNRIEPVAADTTDDQGYYEFAALRPGSYFLSVSAKPWYAVHSVSSARQGADSDTPGVASSLDVAYPATYNNGATDSQSATPISVQGGDRLQADVHLNPVPVLHLILRVPGDAQPPSPLFAKRVFDSVEFVQSEGMQQVSSGVYEILGVPAGKYSVQFQDTSNHLQQSGEMNFSRDGQELDPTQSEPSAQVKLSVKMPREEPVPKELNVALQDSSLKLITFKPVDATGQVEFENLAAGKYSVLAFAQAKRYSVVRTVPAGGQISEHNLNLTPGSSLTASVYLADGRVSVEGFVKRSGKPSAGVMVALVPKDPQSHLDMFRRDQSDSDGSFVVRGVIPGTYTLIAVEDAWGFPWQQPAVLNRYLEHGQTLTVGELMTNSVHLPDAVEVQPR
jgi:hypothetical protein